MTVLESRPQEWMDQAACATVATDMFFADQDEWRMTRDAKAVCETCDVRAQCLAYAQKHEKQFGVFGGLTVPERRALRHPRKPRATRV